MLELKNVVKKYDDQTTAINNLNLSIKENEFIALLGPSGCGKTTTLNMVAGLLDTTEGQILFNGEDITNHRPGQRDIGMVFQSYALYPHLTVRENIAFPLKQQGISKADRNRRAEEMAAQLKIETFLDRKPAQLSGGQQQRVSICRAMVRNPKMLLMDEPMSNLDSRLKIEIREIIKQIHRDHNIISIIVTHDQEEAMALADRIAILENGSIQQFDTPENLYNNPANIFVANFMGNPPMNFLPAKLNNGSLELGNQAVPVTSDFIPIINQYEGQSLTLGIRPSSLELDSNSAQAMDLQLSNVEYIGDNLLVSGTIDGHYVRVMSDQVDQYQRLSDQVATKTSIKTSITGPYVVFDQDGNNISSLKEHD